MVKEELANRPDNTAFTQQRLPAWQPMLSAGIVIPGFLLIGLAFIGIGVALFVTSQSIQVLEVWEVKPPVFASCWFPSTCHPEPATIYWKRCGVANKGRGVVSINNGGSCPFFTSWITQGNSRPPLATSALILLSRTVFAIWNSALLPCSRLDPNAHFMMLGSADAMFSSTGARVLLLWFVQLLPELQEIWRVQRWRAAVWRLGQLQSELKWPDSTCIHLVYITFLSFFPFSWQRTHAPLLLFIHVVVHSSLDMCISFKVPLSPHCWDYGQCPTLNLTHMPFCLVCPRAPESTALPTSMTAMISPSYRVAR